ncbi:MAG: ketopantoate reductase family protein [Micropepsaceae bacterium]
MSDIALIGPGAIGCAFAAAAMQAGHDIHVAARTPVQSLDVTYPDGHVQGPVHQLTAQTVRPFSVVMLAVKAHQTLAAKPWLDGLCAKGTVLAVLQNGVEHIERLKPLVADGVQIVPAMVACPATRIGPGHVQVTGQARLDVPRGPASDAFRRVFENSFGQIIPVDDWQSSAWAKLVLNAASGGIGVLTRRGNEVLKDPEIGRLFRALAAEVIEVGLAEGAKLSPELGERLLAVMTSGKSLHKPSIVVDRITNQPTEWQARNEVVLKKAAKHGIPVPLNDLVCNLIRAGEPQQ